MAQQLFNLKEFLGEIVLTLVVTFGGLSCPNTICALGTFKKYVRSRFPSFDPLPPYSPFFVSEHPFPTQGTFVLPRTHPFPLNFYTCEIQRKEINDEYQYLWLNSTCLLRSHNGISINWTPSVHNKSTRFMEMSSLQRVHLKLGSLQK